ncbi:hypothetical protein [Nitrosomonas aestuarii]|uniref:hypothetical protein n=1 Tax=Nitrosomonas aestuarii TaxID=52441 RepID=UPI000B8660E8|nr:hypothetical protein [Nitrosomonas aestuarii]
MLEQLLPTLLCIKGASILDDSLSVWLNQNGHVLKKPYRNDFNGRICYIGDSVLYENFDELHAIRKERNAYADDPGVKSSWDELEVDIKSIEACLVAFGLVVKTKNLEYFAERSAVQESDDSKIAFTRRFSYGVKEDGKLALEIAWNQNTLNE